MNPETWLKEHEKYFSREMNGYYKPPLEKYLSILSLIDRDGKIIDLGCGNGMLLKFLMDISGHKLAPWGVDFNGKAIKQAREEILPEYAGNFILSDIELYDFSHGPFDIIVADPLLARHDTKKYAGSCIKNLTRNGRLIFMSYSRINPIFDVFKSEQLPDLVKMGMRFSRGYELVFGVLDK